MEPIKGRVVYKLGNDINTDKILAGRYLVLTGDEELAEHCFEGHIEDWNEKVKKGDILVAGNNFGCGSSREHAPVALKGSGIAAVIAESFGRIFYRNSIAIGMPVIIIPDISSKVKEGDALEVDFSSGTLTITQKNETVHFDPFPDFIQAYLDEGGISNYVRNRVMKNQ